MAIGDTVLQAGTDLAHEWGPDGPHATAGDQRWYEIAYPGSDYLLLNPSGALTGDETVRKAVGLALDRTAAAVSFFEPGGTTILDEALRVRDEPVADLMGPNADAARALLAGRTGTLRFAIPTNCDQCLDSANSIKSNLAAIGLTVDIVQEDDPQGAAGTPKDKIDIVASYSQAPFPDAATLVDQIVTTGPQGWFDEAQINAADALLDLSGDERDQQAADMAQSLTGSAMVIPYGLPADGVYFGPSVGCRTIIPGIINVDLVALCPATP
jgi:ABC-type oligopeptide transport system substrate-binding subunit